ncbi:MAG: disulfide bond formation protein B [Burkholderiales bacterium]
MRTLSAPRGVFALMFLACAGLMGFGLYLQHVLKLEPCPLCILQRYAFIAAGIAALIAALHNPKKWGRRFYALLVLVFSGAGAGVAGRQVWLQHNPQVSAECGPGLEYMLESFPLSQVLPMLFKGEGDCAKVVWQFLGLSIPEWALVWFVLLLLAALWVAFSRDASSPPP